MKLIDLFEAPLADVSIHKGDTRGGGGFSATDLKVIEKNITQKVYHDKLKKVPFDLYVYFIDDDDLGSMGELFPEREVDLADFEKGQLSPHGSKARIYKVVRKVVLDKVIANKEKNKDAVHLIMGDNYSESNQIAPTPWILAHRLIHCISQARLINIDALVDLKKLAPVSIARGSGSGRAKISDIAKAFTFKSAKSGKIVGEDGGAGELWVEMITQYLVTGKLPYDKEKFPTDVRDKMVTIVEQVVNSIPEALNKVKGKIFYI